jgi:hypothetical protein
MRGAPGIDDKMQGALETGNHQVIKNSARFIQEQRVAHPPVLDGTKVCRGEALEKRVCTVASQFDLRHVRYIEKSRTVAAGEMFGFNARWVLNRHVPSSEWHHAGAMGDVKVI